ncbi:MAG: hypothetical protein FD167_4492 [bacterium]|nr:MAG: hypothetical protein FD167_4492 [bacterium]
MLKEKIINNLSIIISIIAIAISSASFFINLAIYLRSGGVIGWFDYLLMSLALAGLICVAYILKLDSKES